MQSQLSTSNILLLGDRVLVQLDEIKDFTTTPEGIKIPKFVNVESDGGRPKARILNQKHIPIGTVIAISDFAKEKSSLQVGDRVLVNPKTVSQDYHFLLNREDLVQAFDGVISVPYVLIEAKII